MSESRQTFVDACLAGNALLDEIDDWVDQWHDLGDDDPRSLNEYLGFSSPEGELWVRDAFAVRYIIAARRRNVPVENLLANKKDFALAARSSDPREVERVVEMLVESGKLARGEAT
jgi:hypothetical protein